MRDTEGLYCFAETANCALNNCRACAYKLCQEGPNARPEECLSKERPCTLFNGLRVLTVGDGDMSFSEAVRRGGGRVTATTHARDRRDLLDRYGSIPDLDIHYAVDATDLKFSTDFDRIIFNFPCVDGEDVSGSSVTEESVLKNQDLIRRFAKCARPILSEQGEIWITHKTKEPFAWWDIPNLVPDFKGKIVFDRFAFPPYINRKAFEKKSFPAHDALIYVFIGTTTLDSLLAVTPDLLRQVKGKRKR